MKSLSFIIILCCCACSHPLVNNFSISKESINSYQMQFDYSNIADDFASFMHQHFANFTDLAIVGDESAIFKIALEKQGITLCQGNYCQKYVEIHLAQDKTSSSVNLLVYIDNFIIAKNYTCSGMTFNSNSAFSVAIYNPKEL